MNDELARLKTMLSDEQIRQMVDMLERAYDRAITRKYGQTFHLFFNQNGHPTEFGVTDNVRGVTPRQVAPLE